MNQAMMNRILSQISSYWKGN